MTQKDMTTSSPISSSEHGSSDDRGSSEAPPRLVRRLFGLAWAHRIRVVGALALALVAQALMLSGFVFSGVALDTLRHWASPEAVEKAKWPFDLAPPGDWSMFQHVMLAAVFVLGFTLIRSVVHFFTRLADEGLVQAIIVDLRVKLYDRLQRMDFRFYDTHDSGTLINRVTGDASSVRMFIQGVIVRLLVTSCTLVLFLIYMVQVHWMLTVAVLATVPVQIIIMRRYTKRIRPKFKSFREAMDRLIQTLQESVLGARIVRGFGQEAQMSERFGDRNSHVRDQRLLIVRDHSTHMPAIPALNFVQLAILLAYGGYLVQLGPAAGGVALGTLWVFFSLIRQISHQIDRIVQTASIIPEALTGAERVFELLDTEPQITAGVDAWNPASKSVDGRIEFDNVSFRYQEDTEHILKNITFTVESGETVAIVGPAGAGKTTLLSLLIRGYDVGCGCISVDGHDIRNWNPKALRANMGIVFQEPFLFSNTISANIRYGQTGQKEDRVQSVADQAAADAFIRSSKDGYDTVIGERGLTLSGGERQRLSLARALYIKPKILLLDDATASVDPETEVRIQNALSEVMQGRTTLIIAHRLSTLRRADRIIVLENGRISAIGTHAELMQCNAHYREAAELQLETRAAAWGQAGDSTGTTSTFVQDSWANGETLTEDTSADAGEGAI